jgi:cytochrome c oxidase subunit 3
MGYAVAWWLRASLLLGIGFLVGQGIAWYALKSSGQFLTTGARTAFFYVLTSTHALHALGGLSAIAAIAIFGAQMSSLRRYLVVDLTAWYLHSMTLLWMYLLCFLLLA